jgi:hypothetical protein
MLQATFEPVSNREDWIQQCEVRNEDGELIDLTDAAIVMAVRDRQSRQQKLLAQTSDSTITIEATGIFTFSFSVTQMRGLDASKTYDMGCTIQLNGTVQQFFVGSVPVIDGIVP